jgi:hypothetical protein
MEPSQGSLSEAYQRQLDAFNAARDAALQAQMMQFGVQQQQSLAGAQQYAGTTRPMIQQAPPADSYWSDPDLVGAAVYWGMPEETARQMPRTALEQFVNSHRQSSHLDESWGSLPAQLASLPAMFAVGVGQSLTGGLTRLPIIGESLKRMEILQQADMELRKLEEGVRATTPASQEILNTVIEGGGHLAGLWFPGQAAWALAGRLGRVSTYLNESRHAMAAFQGGLSTWMLEGNSDLYKQHPYLMTGGGMLLGTAGEALIEPMGKAITALQNRTVKSFVPDFLLRPKKSPIDESLAAMEIPVNVNHPPEQAVIDAANAGDPSAMALLDDMRRTRNVPEINPAPLQRDVSGMEIPLRTGQKPVSDPFVEGETWWANSTSEAKQGWIDRPVGTTTWFDLTRAEQTQALERIGYNMRGEPAIDVEGAGQLSTAMNKAAIVTESPIFPELVNRTQLDDITVAEAAIATNPGGSNIVQGVSDPAAFASSVAPKGYNVAFAQHGKRLDAIVSDLPITNKMIAEYESFGVYVGQKVVSPGGIEGTVQFVDKSDAVVQDMFSGQTHKFKLKDLHNNPISVGNSEVPHLWEGFQLYTLRKLEETSAAMGGAITPAQLQAVKAQNITKWSADFLTDMGIVVPGDRARILQYFDDRFVNDFKTLVPRETAETATATATARRTQANIEQPPLQRSDELLATKGFVVIPDKGGYLIKDVSGLSRAEIRFESLDAAEEAIRNTQRELPDITPPSDVPVQIIPMHLREATQGANTNASSFSKTLESIVENAEGGAGNFVGGPPPVANAASGNVGRMKNQWTDGFLRWRPARRFFSQIDEALHEANLPTNISADYDGISNLVTIHHNNMHPFMDRLTDITRQIKTNRLVSGEWGRFWMAGSGREAMARSANIPEAEIKLFAEFDQLLQDVGGDVASARSYFAHIASRQSDPAMVGRAFDDFPLGDATRPFSTYQKKGNLNLREFDPRHVGEGYIRSVFYQKDLAGPVEAIRGKWDALSKIEEMKPASGIMKNWLDIIENGYHAEDDLALDVLHGTLRTLLGPEVSRSQAKELFNFGLNATHAGLLGFRFHVMARDSLQLLFAIPRAGTDLLNVMRKAMVSPEYIKEIFNDALDAGAISLQSPRMAAPGSFAGELEAASAGLPPRELGVRMRTAAKVTGAVRDLMPSWLRDTRDSPLHAMYFYGKQSEFMKAMVYTAGKNKAEVALAEFRAAGPAGDMQKLLKDTGARTYDPSWVRQFERIVATGADDKAAQFLGRQLADATQFKYGVTESPWVAKSLTGRVAMQMGNYSLQYFQYLRESISAGMRVARTTGDVSDLAKFLTTMGTVTAGLEVATRETGWNFRWMNPYFGLGFTGGPLIGAVADISRGASTMFQQQQGRPVQERVVNAGVQAAERTAINMNPLGGLIRTAEGIGQAVESPYPGQTIGRLLITGEMGVGTEVNRWAMPQAQQFFQQSIQPMPSPVSATQQGVPGPAPQQPVTMPQMIQGGPGPNNNPWTPTSPASPPPGGSPYGMGIPATQPTPDDVKMAAIGYDPNKLFSPQDMEFLSQFYGDPQNAWHGWTYYKEGQIRKSTQGGTQQPPRSYPDSIPGAGAQF